MDLRRIRHFTVLAEALHFSRAAERLHIAQPALSTSIQKLESELGTKLFERSPTGVVLTASGEAALVEARRVLYHSEQLMRTARDASSGTGGRLRVGFVGSAVQRVIPSLIPSFRRDFPRIELVLTESTSDRIVVMLHDESLDIGIVRTPLSQSHGVVLHTLQRDRFVMALPASHPLLARTELRLADLADEPFIMYSDAEAIGLHVSAVAACEAAGFVPQITQKANQVSTVLALVESGLGVALVPEIVRGQREPKVAFREIQGAGSNVEMTLALAYHPGNESPAALRFIEASRALHPD